MKRIILAVMALLAAPALAASVPSLTLANLKGPVARICRVTPATSIAQLWAQLGACPSIPAPIPVPAPSPTPTPSGIRVLSEGDSISVFWGGNHTGMYAAAHPDVTFYGRAVGGSTVPKLVERLPADLALRPTHVTVLIGSNDLSVDTGTWLASLWSYTQSLRASGAKVAVGTILPICLPAYPTNTAAFNKARVTANAAIRQAVGVQINAVIDFAANPVIGGDAAGCDKTLYSDGQHLTDAGQRQMLSVYGSAVDKLIAPVPDISAGLKPSWGTGEIPGLYTADSSEGAFRFTCKGDGPLASDDPLVYPGKPGASHLHLAWGNTAFNANATHASLMASAATNCNAAPLSLNRSSYWMPALIDEQGAVFRPELVSVYYKRGSRGGKFCDPASPWFVGVCTSLPDGIAYVFGWNALDPSAKVQGASWYCTGGDKLHHANLNAVFASGCKAGDILVANTIAPDCWNGTRLDSPDHRSHVAYSDYSPGDGMAHCPAGYPNYFPQEENKAMWTVTAAMIAADGTSRVMLSSDHMKPGALPGETLHADYIEAWNPAAKAIWEANCIDKALSCSGGDLGNGKQLIGAS